MAIYRVQGPDGAIHRFEGPDNATPEQVTAAAAMQFGKPAQAAPAETPKPVDPTDSMSTTQKVLAGAGKAFVDTGRGLKQLLLDIPANALENLVEGKNTSELITGKHQPTSMIGRLGQSLGMPTAQESGQQTQANIDEAKRLDAPLMATKAGMAGNIAGNVAIAAAPGSLIARSATLAPKLNALQKIVSAVPGGQYALPAASGMIQGAIQPVASDESRSTNALVGMLGGAGGKLIANGVGKLAQGAAPKVSQAVRDLAQKAEDMGINIRADQLVNSKPLNAISATLDYLPFSGMGAAKTSQQKQFNTAISRVIGQDSDNVVQAVKNAETDLGGKFDEVLKNNHVKADDGLLSGLAKIQENARNELTDAQFGVVNRQIDNLLSKVKDGDVIDADAAYNIKKGLDRLGKSNDTSLAHYAADMRGELMDALNRSLPPDVAKAFAQTRQQYRNLIELRKLVPAGAEGDISAAKLANAKTSGQLKDLSDISAQFLKGRVGDSGTMPRLAAFGALTGGGSMLGLSPTALGLGLTAGRATTSALKSNALKSYLANGSAPLQRALPLTNRLLPLAGAPVAIDAFE